MHVEIIDTYTPVLLQYIRIYLFVAIKGQIKTIYIMEFAII